MKTLLEKLRHHQAVLAGTVILTLTAGLVYSIYSFHKLSAENTARLEDIERLQEDKIALLAKIRKDTKIIDSFQEEIQTIGTTVGNLKKLSETDEELLKKYSRVYFLNENFIPSRLSKIPTKYLYQEERDLFIHTDVWPALQKLLDEAGGEGHELLVASAYRSFGTQAELKSHYSVSYGSGANQFSADQGYSEHQLGTTVDLTTPENGTNFSKFEETEAYQWLTDHAWKHGFILSYPQGNSHYKFEPWHWRFVGKALAKYIHIEKLSFYDLDQREIDKYLLIIFNE